MSKGSGRMSKRMPLSKAAPLRLVAALLAAAIMVGSGATVALAATPVVSVRVEGSNSALFQQSVPVGTSVITDTDHATHAETANALTAVDVAARLGGFPYEVTNSAYGLYVSSVNGELPVPAPPYPGWLYRVNGALLSVGADQITLKNGDSVLWYYGTYDASPTVAVAPSVVTAGRNAKIVAKQLDPNGLASPLVGATVHVGSRVATSDAEGAVSLPMNEVGVFGVRVEKAGFIRSGLSSLSVRYATAFTRFALSKSAIRSGATVTVSGTLASNGKAFSGRRVRVYYRKKGSSKWVASTRATTSSAGKFSLKVKPKKSTYYKVVFAGDSTHLSTTSATKLLTVR
jgi:hypothetical protein